MTTPDGTPSVSSSPRNLGEQLQDPSAVAAQVNPSGGGQWTGRGGEPTPEVIGDSMEDVFGRYTEGATVASDQGELDVTAPRGPQPDV